MIEPDESRVGDRDERGFALLVALLALVGLTALASAGYVLSDTDYRINQSHRASTRAFYVADAGLERYLGDGRIWPDTIDHVHPDGAARVWATKLVDVDSVSTLFHIGAEGVHTPPEGGTARRRLGTVAIVRAAPFTLNSAFTSPPGLDKQGVAGILSGFDAANYLECGLTGPQHKAGLQVPPDGLTVSGGGGGKGQGGGGDDPPGFEGDPAVDDSMSELELLLATGIDWPAITSGDFAQADFVYSADGYPNFSSDVPADYWPMVVIDQPSFRVRPTESGRGTLIVHGDLEIDGAFEWDGIVLVGGQITSNGNNIIEGAVVGGLNGLLGQSVEENQLGNGTWEWRYHSCNVINALKGIGALAEEPGAWREAI